MARGHGSHQHLQRREAALFQPGQFSNPRTMLAQVMSKREPSDSSSSSSSNICGKNDKSDQCGKPSDNNVTLPVVLGVVIPLFIIIVVFIFLHRRHVKRLHREDANDPHKSLDFGMEPSDPQYAGRRMGKEGIAETKFVDLGIEKAPRHRPGTSMDMGNPYFLPPGLQGSRDSLHSLSRTMHSGDDRYRPATAFIASDSTSVHSDLATRKLADDSSSTNGLGSGRLGYTGDGMNQHLLRDVQGMSQSSPPSHHAPAADTRIVPEVRTLEPERMLPHKTSAAHVANSGMSPAIPTDSRDSYSSKSGADLRKSNNYLGAFINSREPSADLLSQPNRQKGSSEGSSSSSIRPNQISKSPPPTTIATMDSSRPPRLQSLQNPKIAKDQNKFLDDTTSHGETLKITSKSQKTGKDSGVNTVANQSNQSFSPSVDGYTLPAIDVPTLGYDVRRLSMGFRPLPPDDPTDNPEQRANRIRSFYKEYFDESKQGPAHAHAQQAQYYDERYARNGRNIDPPSTQFAVPQPQFAEPFSRRAMTPPPRAPPRHQGRPNHQPSMSGSGFVPRGARAFSSGSSRYGFSASGAPRPPLPPPSPLRVLPSPHLLKEDSFALPIDFAPPNSYKDRQAGRPESPRGGMRPYSPMIPAHLPLASSFDDLSVMPSPHSLRKSGTFTALDFAPPPRFKSSDSASDTGSIRSNRSAMSAQQLQSIRAGAYRVSRIPKEVVGTKNEINDSLRPQWGMRNP